MTITVDLLGDSTLDNGFWVKKENSVEGKLQQKGVRVFNHAYDGFTTNSVLKGDWIGAVLPRRDGFAAYMKERAPNGTWVQPLAELQKRITEHPDVTHHVGVSVMGNDFRINIHRPWALIKEIPQIQARYMQIVEKVKGLQGRDIKPILIFQYRTDAKTDLPYLIYTVFSAIGAIAVAVHLVCIALIAAPVLFFTGYLSGTVAGILCAIGALSLFYSQKVVPLTVTKDVLLGNRPSLALINRLMERFYEPILAMAKKERLPVLDLPNTFNPYHDLYESNIEPNANGAQLIADGIHHIATNHDYAGESKLYAKPNGQAEYSAKPNAGDWKVAMPSR